MLDDGSVGVLIAVAKDSCKVLTNKVSASLPPQIRGSAVLSAATASSLHLNLTLEALPCHRDLQMMRLGCVAHQGVTFMQSTPEQQRVRVCRQLDIKRKIDNFRNISTVVSLCTIW